MSFFSIFNPATWSCCRESTAIPSQVAKNKKNTVQKNVQPSLNDQAFKDLEASRIAKMKKNMTQRNVRTGSISADQANRISKHLCDSPPWQGKHAPLPPLANSEYLASPSRNQRNSSSSYSEEEGSPKMQEEGKQQEKHRQLTQLPGFILESNDPVLPFSPRRTVALKSQSQRESSQEAVGQSSGSRWQSTNAGLPNFIPPASRSYSKESSQSPRSPAS